MRIIFFISFLMIYALQAKSQTYKGTAAEFDKVYDMSKTESYNSLRNSGEWSKAFKNINPAFIDFKSDGINLAIIFENDRYFVLKLNFKYKENRNMTVISNEDLSLKPMFVMTDEQGNQTIIEYFSFKDISKDSGGMFVISQDSKMYFLIVEDDLHDKLVKIYTE